MAAGWFRHKNALWVWTLIDRPSETSPFEVSFSSHPLHYRTVPQWEWSHLQLFLGRGNANTIPPSSLRSETPRLQPPWNKLVSLPGLGRKASGKCQISQVWKLQISPHPWHTSDSGFPVKDITRRALSEALPIGTTTYILLLAVGYCWSLLSATNSYEHSSLIKCTS